MCGEMKIKCPNCENEFEWEAPEDTAVMRNIAMDDFRERETRRYAVTCPHCKTRMSVSI